MIDDVQNNRLTFKTERRVRELLSRQFPNISSASTEIINLEAILNLPKGTEHFVADLHGEDEAFQHIIKNASGNIKRKVNEIFQNNMREGEIAQLCALIYYPEQKLELIEAEEGTPRDFYLTTLNRLVAVLKSVSSKYTRSKVRKALPKSFAYIIEELLHEQTSGGENKQMYYNGILETIVSTGQGDEFITAICKVIQKLTIDRLHILGDIFDRGPGAHRIMDILSEYKGFDMTWGNHDVLWMGAAVGNESCITNVLRIALRYANMTSLEDGYGINLLPLATFAMDVYGEDSCDVFMPKVDTDAPKMADKSIQLMARMHKAIAIIQFKLEGQLIAAHPEWCMEERCLLSKISTDRLSVTLPDGKVYMMNDTSFPTLNPENPYELTDDERELMNKLVHSFRVSDKLKRHMEIMLAHGRMYQISNSNLMFHASVPLNDDGSLKVVDVMGTKASGRQLYDNIEMLMRAAFTRDTDKEMRDYSRDYYWYLWCGPDSPLFDKHAMTTFERYFVQDKTTHEERKGNYYLLRDNPDVCDYIMKAFGVEGTHCHIINGHVPVKVGKGETPVKAQGKLMVIDGGFAKAYHNTTGIAGYTLVFHSRGFQLVQHEPFTSVEDVIRSGADIVATTQLVELSQQRMRVRDTDKGKELQAQIDELRELLYAYRHGLVNTH